MCLLNHYSPLLGHKVMEHTVFGNQLYNLFPASTFGLYFCGSVNQTPVSIAPVSITCDELLSERSTLESVNPARETIDSALFDVPEKFLAVTTGVLCQHPSVRHEQIGHRFTSRVERSIEMAGHNAVIRSLPCLDVKKI